MKYIFRLVYPALNAASIACSIISSVIVLQMMSRIRCVAASGASVIELWRAFAAAVSATGPVSTRFDGSDRCSVGRRVLIFSIAGTIPV